MKLAIAAEFHELGAQNSKTYMTKRNPIIKQSFANNIAKMLNKY